MAILILVLAQFFQKLIGLVEMHDPGIQSYKRPIYLEEDEDDVSLSECKFFYGIYLAK